MGQIPISRAPGLVQQTSSAAPVSAQALRARGQAVSRLGESVAQAGEAMNQFKKRRQQADDLEKVQKLENLYNQSDIDFEETKKNLGHADWVKAREDSFNGLGADIEKTLSPEARTRWDSIKNDRISRSVLNITKQANREDVREKFATADVNINSRIDNRDYQGALEQVSLLEDARTYSKAQAQAKRDQINQARIENDANIMLQENPAKLEQDLLETETVNGQKVPKNFKSLSDAQRRTLLSQAQSQQKADNAVALSQLKDDTFASMNEAQTNPDAEPLTEEEFMDVMGDGRGKVAHKEYERRFKAVAATGQILRESKQMNPTSALTHAQEQLEKIPDTPESAPIKAAMIKQIAAENQQKLDNRATWASQMDEVKEYDIDLDAMKDEEGNILEGMEEQFKSAFSERTEMLIAMQGRAPQDPEGEQLNPDRYLGLPRGAANIVDSAQAKQKVSQFNDMNSQEFVESIQSELSLYENPDHQAILMKDYVEAGLDQRYQVVAALSTLSPSDATTLAQAIEQDGENSDAIGKDRAMELKDLLDSNESMYEFQSALTGSLGENFGTVAGFGKAVESQAKFFMAKFPSLSAQEALDLSMDRIINSQVGTTIINGQAVSVSRQNEDGVERTDDEINDIGRRLNVLMERIDVRGLDLSPFFDIPEGTEDHIGFVSQQLGLDERDLAQQIRTEITGSGVWRGYPDGQGSYLEITTGPGESRALQSKDGKYLFARYSQLPDFMRTVDVPAFQGKFASRPATTRQEAIQPGDDFEKIRQVTGGTSSVGSTLRNQLSFFLSPFVEFQPAVETTNWPTMDPSIEFIDEI